MIKFFRRIRQKLLSENRFNKYLLYAIGEIVLVVVGILIALQINNWNEKSNNLDLANNYISNLIEELNIQIATLDDIYISRFDRKLKGLESAKSYFEEPFVIKDTLSFLNDISFGAVGSYGIENFNRNVFESLISTGVISHIEPSLRNKILDHYEYARHAADRSQAQASNYQNAVNGLRPFYIGEEKPMSKTDQIRFINALRTEEFIKQVNIEISNGLHSMRRILKVKNSAENLIVLIDEYLEIH